MYFAITADQSHYGSEIPLACAGIISKVNMIFFSLVIGLSQGLQPIVSFNYGAGNTPCTFRLSESSMYRHLYFLCILFMLSADPQTDHLHFRFRK